MTDRPGFERAAIRPKVGMREQLFGKSAVLPQAAQKASFIDQPCWLMRPAMKPTSRLRRSSLATHTETFRRLACFSAAASCGRRVSASAPLAVSISVYSAAMVEAFSLGEGWQPRRAALADRDRCDPASGC